ncbi:MAG: lamin tail domain-containing protein [Candidatus Niyogibacteria bacterium]|nr:lamin tail domain-containing protein [Candidatus Niyogibacteria bacterium]
MFLLRLFFILGAFTVFPLFARADVLINEIAWMGTAVSASDEWMELYNNGGASVDLAGWTLSAADGTPNISLQGIVPAKSFYLLERTNDATVPNVAADLIYTGALSNAGEMLILRDSSGAEADRADGSGGWSALGGNNETKETAQRMASGWVTGAPTPKAANYAVAPETSSAPVQPNNVSASASASVDARNFTPKFNAKIYGGENTLTAGVEAEFRGGAEGLSNEETKKARFLWSFGDGVYQDGAIARHTYTRPGSYNISLNVILEPYSASDYARMIVLAGQPPVSQIPVKPELEFMAQIPADIASSSNNSVNSAVPINTAEKSLNTANVSDAGLNSSGNAWFWFLISLAVGVIGAVGFILIKIYY